jgi:hypothetical protein
MNHNKICAVELDGSGFDKPNAKTPVSTAPLFAPCRAGTEVNRVLIPVSSVPARDTINAAIDQWAESLVAIIVASENPEASLLQAHLAIAIKHKELQALALRELEVRRLPSGAMRG